jgi:hypothetical protein
MFSSITSLSALSIGNNVTAIGGSAFSGCTGLTSITIPTTINNVTGNAFSGVTSVTIDGSATNTIIPASMFSSVTTLGSLSIGSNVTAIGSSAFSGCSGLIDQIYFPNNLNNISSNAFQNCTSMTSINLINVTSLGNSAFNGCAKLASVVSYSTNSIIPNSVTSVFSPVGTTNATIYTNYTDASNDSSNYKQYFANFVINQSLTSVTSAAIPYTTPGTQSINNVVSLNGPSSPTNLLYGIPQSSDSNQTNYIETLHLNSYCSQYTIYNTSGTPQYFQFLPYCNGKSSSQVKNVYSISNNICTIQNNCVVCFLYTGKINFVPPSPPPPPPQPINENYVATYAATLS